MKNKAQFKSNDILAFNLQGIYRVEAVDSLNMGGNGPTDYYILSQVSGRLSHKTYVKVDRAGSEGLRPVVSKQDLTLAKSKFVNFVLAEMDSKMNSKMNCVEKIGVFTKMMINDGFAGSLQAYLASTHELKKKKEDKKIKDFSNKLKNQIIEEISLSESISIEEAKNQFEAILKSRELVLC